MLAEQTTAPPLDDLRAVAERDEVLAAIADAARRLRRGERRSLRRRRFSGTRARARSSPSGASPRSGIALLRMAKARAVARGRDYVLPEDVQARRPCPCSRID